MRMLGTGAKEARAVLARTGKPYQCHTRGKYAERWLLYQKQAYKCCMALFQVKHPQKYTNVMSIVFEITC